MKKILVISASPRKGGNSDTLCDEFIRGAAEGGNDVEKIFIRDKKIGYCVACDYCAKHNGECVQKDDMAEILNKMIAADVIVLSTPVYFYTLDAQLKTLIDRCVARYTEISNKEFYFIVTAADGSKKNLELTVNCLRGFTDMCLNNPVERGVIYGAGVWQRGEVNNKSVMREAYDYGKNA